MEYTINKLANIAGVSTRTLRYYDEIDLLKPCRINSSGYRIYGEKEIDILQQIMFYRSMDMKLSDIKDIISNPNFEVEKALEKHEEELIKRREEIDELIRTVQKTIKNKKGEIKMSNKEKFEGFKKEKIEENEKKYGKEIRQKYGEETVKESNKKFMNLKEEDFEKVGKIEKELFDLLKVILESNNIEGEEGKRVYELHREWLSFTWPKYTKEAHIGLANMYLQDERFKSYYNERVDKGATEILRDCIVKYAI
jgi:DNA-binding transcriptional MerR regulator